MKRRTYGRDGGLILRMLATTGLLGLLYVVFGAVLINVLNFQILPMVLIIAGLAFFLRGKSRQALQWGRLGDSAKMGPGR